MTLKHHYELTTKQRTVSLQQLPCIVCIFWSVEVWHLLINIFRTYCKNRIKKCTTSNKEKYRILILLNNIHFKNTWDQINYKNDIFIQADTAFCVFCTKTSYTRIKLQFWQIVLQIPEFKDIHQPLGKVSAYYKNMIDNLTFIVCGWSSFTSPNRQVRALKLSRYQRIKF